MKWIGLFAVAGAAVALALLRVDSGPPATPDAAVQRDAPTRGGGAAPARSPQPEAAQDRPAPASDPTGPAVGSDRVERPEAEHDAHLEEELRWTEEAIAASRDRAEGGFREPEPDRPREPASRVAFGAAAALCKGAGSSCGSSADCCAGLACVGGVAGYGTPGRCEAPVGR